jgi:hypothetical protein
LLDQLKMKKKTVIEPNGHVDIHKHTFRGNDYPKPETFDFTPITAKATNLTQLVKRTVKK